MIYADNSKQRTLAALKDGSWHSTAELARTVGIQHNTLLKNLKFLRDDGQPVERREVVKGETKYSEWLLRKLTPKAKAEQRKYFNTANPDSVRESYMARKAEYETFKITHHPEYLKICTWLEAKGEAA